MTWRAALLGSTVVTALVLFAFLAYPQRERPQESTREPLPPPPAPPPPPPRPVRASPVAESLWPSEALGLRRRHLSVAELLHKARLASSYYAVNLGALAGGYTDGDAVNELWFAEGAGDLRWRSRGLAVEGVAAQCAAFQQRAAGLNLSVECSFLSPLNVAAIFARHTVPREFDVLKIDIDSLDCPVLDAVLRAGYRPRLVHMEINFEIPPPVVFSVEYSPALLQDWFWQSLPESFRGLYGCSLSRVAELGRQHGYRLLQAEFHDVDLVRADLVAPHFGGGGNLSYDPAVLYDRGVRPACAAMSHFVVPNGCQFFLSVPAEDRARAVWEQLVTRLPNETLRLVPFRLYTDPGPPEGVNG